ncbi:MAG: hypothetical protein ACYCR7_02760 [Thermoplasmataceae archaeon]
MYFIGHKHKEPSFFDNLLRKSKIEIEWFRAEEGLRTALTGIKLGSFAENFRDLTIGSHASIAPWIVVTNNIKDFDFLGDRVRLPDEFKRDNDK